MVPTDHDLQSFFTKKLMYWHLHHNTRQMPWKGEADPYKIWLSEIILQQTQVAQGWAYYIKFIDHYPTVVDLAKAKDDAVYKLWEGLGYYSRCKNLLIAARQIVNDFDGNFPKTYADIRQLKGVGDYTAAAIASFAFGMPYAVVDGNVTRVLSRYFNLNMPIDGTAGKKLFAALAQNLLAASQPAAYNQAIMDFGATICKPKQPACEACFLQKNCQGYALQTVAGLPVKSKAAQKKKRWFCYLILRFQNNIMIKQRPAGDIWENLHEFFLIEDEAALTLEASALSKLVSKKFDTKGVKINAPSPIFTQQLTHQTINARFVMVDLPKKTPLPQGFNWSTTSKLKALAWPRIISIYLQQNALAPAP